MDREGAGSPQIPTTRPPDSYEADHMKTEGEAIFREKMLAPWYFHLLFALPALTSLLTALDSEVPLLVPLLSSTLMLAIWALFVAIRVTVSTQEVYIQYGVFGPKIPIEAISHCEAVEYNWMEFGGWGIRRSFDGTWAYNMPGDQGKGVKLTWTDAKGKLKKTLIGTKNAVLLADAINRARRGEAVGSGVLHEEHLEAPAEIDERAFEEEEEVIVGAPSSRREPSR